MRQPTEEHQILLATLPPSPLQRQLARIIVVALLVAFVITAPFTNVPLPRVDAYIPSVATALLINDLLTSALLFAQFSIVCQRALLVLAGGYLFSGLMVIPFALTFPGLFAPTGLLGGGLQSPLWFYVIWHIGLLLCVIIYAVLKDSTSIVSLGSARTYIGLSVMIVIAVAFVVTWIITSQQELLPKLFLDSTRLSPFAPLAAGSILLLAIVALGVLWRRANSVLDLWLMVAICAWLPEITLSAILISARYSLGWYMGRVYSLVTATIVLVVLLSETTTLYAHLGRSVMRLRREREGRDIAMDQMAASIAHEVNQPLGAIALNSQAALLFLARVSPNVDPNIDKVRGALEAIISDSDRGSAVIAGLRAMFKKGAHKRTLFDVNDLVREVLTMLEVDLLSQCVSVSVELRQRIPRVLADRGQLQQVLLNLIMNAIEAMRSVTDRARRLRVTSDITHEPSGVVITIQDSGTGIDRKDKDRIFEPFFTTKSTGTGIGLTICRSIIESHGGNLRVSVNNPYGTIFHVTLPKDDS